MRVCKCQYDCGEFEQETLQNLFKEFYQKDYNGQTTHLAESCVQTGEIIRNRVGQDISKRHCTVKYYLKNDGSLVRVCKQFLCHVYQITPRRIQMLVEKLKYNKPLFDCRGSHDNRPNKVPDFTRDLVMDHIKSFPLQENHYSRNESKKQCLDADLSIRKMWNLFTEKYPDSKCSLHYYREIFNTKFHLRFGLPRSDTCELCDSLYIKMRATNDPEVLKQLEIETKMHHARADSGYKSLDNDSKVAQENKGDIIVVCVDLEQVLYCPTLTHGNIFYQRQLSCYNFCIDDLGNKKATMCLWDETKGKRGSAEIASAILAFVTLNFNPLKENKKRHFIMWSDRCVGQNNNWKMVALMQHLLMNNYFTTVEQKFMTTGHSFLPCDREFALIERNKKNAMVYVPDQWIEVIANSSTKFEVMPLVSEDFKDLSIVENSMNRGDFRITQYVWLKIAHDDPTTLQARTSHNILQPWTSHCIAKKVKGKKSKLRLPPVKVCRFPRLYEGPLPIQPAKKNDLMSMMPYIPEEFRQFYEAITCQP